MQRKIVFFYVITFDAPKAIFHNKKRSWNSWRRCFTKFQWRINNNSRFFVGRRKQWFFLLSLHSNYHSHENKKELHRCVKNGTTATIKSDPSELLQGSADNVINICVTVFVKIPPTTLFFFPSADKNRLEIQSVKNYRSVRSFEGESILRTIWDGGSGGAGGTTVESIRRFSSFVTTTVGLAIWRAFFWKHYAICQTTNITSPHMQHDREMERKHELRLNFDDEQCDKISYPSGLSSCILLIK